MENEYIDEIDKYCKSHEQKYLYYVEAIAWERYYRYADLTWDNCRMTLGRIEVSDLWEAPMQSLDTDDLIKLIVLEYSRSSNPHVITTYIDRRFNETRQYIDTAWSKIEDEGKDTVIVDWGRLKLLLWHLGLNRESTTIADLHEVVYMNLERGYIQIMGALINPSEIPNTEQPGADKDDTDKPKKISFSELLTCDENIKQDFIKFLKQTFGGKGGKGKLFAIMVCALEKSSLITYEDMGVLHNAIKEIFGDIGISVGLKKYLKKEITLTATHYTTKLTHLEIDKYIVPMKEKISQLKMKE